MYDTFSAWSETIIPWLLTSGLRVLVILVLAFVAHRLASGFIHRTVRLTVRSKYFESEAAELQRENTLTKIFTWTVTIILIVVTLLMLLSEIGIAIAPVLASVGIVGLAVGFGGQYLIRDIITGLFIILENQYRIGDIVSFDGTSGEVIDITLRMTTLRDLDGTVHHIPHGEIKRVSNMSKEFARVNLDVGVSYAANLDDVIKTINSVGQQMSEDATWKATIISAPQFLRVNSLDDSSIALKIIGDVKPGQQWAVSGELRKRLKAEFDRLGIVIPFPQRVLHMAVAE